MTSEMAAVEVPLNDRPHVLYRMFDADSRLLYVGISVHGPDRLNGHRHDKPWWPEIATVQMKHFPNRSAALQAEQAAIRTDNPKYNIAHKPLTRDPLSRVGVQRPICMGEKTGIPEFTGYLDRETAAAYFGIGVQTFDNLRRKNPDFPETEYAGRTPLWKIDDLDKWRAGHPARKSRRDQADPPALQP